MKQKLIIIGAGSVGGHIAHNLIDYQLSDFELLGFLDDDQTKQGTSQFGYPVFGPVDQIFSFEYELAVVIGIAFPHQKRGLIEKVKNGKNLIFPSLVAAGAWVSSNVEIGVGSIIYPGVSINYGSNIGDFVVINMNCSIGHDCAIGDYSSLAPGVNLAGHTVVGVGVDMGIGSCTIQHVAIGSGSIIGGQSMVTNDLKEKSKVAGIPARSILK